MGRGSSILNCWTRAVGSRHIDVEVRAGVGVVVALEDQVLLQKALDGDPDTTRARLHCMMDKIVRCCNDRAFTYDQC